MKFKNYVRIIDGRFITETNNATKMFYCKSEAKAKAFSISSAKDMIYCLACNGISAEIVIRPDWQEVYND